MENGAQQQIGNILDDTQGGERANSVHSEDDTARFVMKGVNMDAVALRILKHYTHDIGLPDYPKATHDQPPLRFFQSMRGRKACVTKDGLIAHRISPSHEFSDAKVFSNRPLRHCELFEVTIDAMDRIWHGNITIGLTSLCPRANALEADEIVMMCGSQVFRNGKLAYARASIDLENLDVGAHVGVMRAGDLVHFYVDGVDMGAFSPFYMKTAWAVVDLYGKCTQISIRPALEIRQLASDLQPHRWSSASGEVSLEENQTVALRADVIPAPLSHGLAFSEHPLVAGDRFEFEIICHCTRFAGALRVGVTDLKLSTEYTRHTTVFTRIPSIARVGANVWYISGNAMYHNGEIIDHMATSLDALRESDCIALELMSCGTLKVLLNSMDINAHFRNIPKSVHVVLELKGTTMAVQLISFHKTAGSQDALKQQQLVPVAPIYKFSQHCGKNIRLTDDRCTAMRTESYNHGVVVVMRPISKGESAAVRIDAINQRWKGAICVGVVDPSTQAPTPLETLSTLMYAKRGVWLAAHDYLNMNSQLMPSLYGKPLEDIKVGSQIVVAISLAGKLVISIDSICLGEFPADPPDVVFPVFDLFGKCEQISLLDVQGSSQPGNDAKKLT